MPCLTGKRGRYQGQDSKRVTSATEGREVKRELYPVYRYKSEMKKGLKRKSSSLDYFIDWQRVSYGAGLRWVGGRAGD